MQKEEILGHFLFIFTSLPHSGALYDRADSCIFSHWNHFSLHIVTVPPIKNSKKINSDNIQYVISECKPTDPSSAQVWFFTVLSRQEAHTLLIEQHPSYPKMPEIVICQSLYFFFNWGWEQAAVVDVYSPLPPFLSFDFQPKICVLSLDECLFGRQHKEAGEADWPVCLHTISHTHLSVTTQ